MIVDSALAQRVEGALADDVAVFVRGRATVDPNSRACRAPVAGGWAAFTGLFGSRVQGAGLAGQVDAAEVDAAERFFDGVAFAPEFEICPLAAASLWEVLAQRRYRLVGFRNVYGVVPRVGSRAQMEILRVGADEFSTWSEIVLDGFGYTDQEARSRVGRWNRMVFDQPEAALFLAVLDGEPVGAANVLVHGEVASLGGTTTLAEFRRRGVQQALLAARLAYANASGSTLAIVTADPGGGSARNIERAGFQLAYTNARLRRPER